MNSHREKVVAKVFKVKGKNQTYIGLIVRKVYKFGTTDKIYYKNEPYEIYCSLDTDFIQI